MSNKNEEVIPYNEWMEEQGSRGFFAANAFGHHLFQTARTKAL